MDFLCECSSCGEKCDISCKKDDVGFCPFCSAKLEHKKRHLPVVTWMGIFSMICGLVALGLSSFATYTVHEAKAKIEVMESTERSGHVNNSGI